MDHEFHIRFTLSDVLKLLVSPVVVVFIFCMFALPWDSKDAPAWVPAVGSIGAIAAAVWIAKRESARGRAEKLVQAHEYMTKAENVAAYAVATISQASEYIVKGASQPAMLEYHRSLLELSLRDLEAIHFTQLDAQKVADGFLALKRATYLASNTIRARLADGAPFDGYQVMQWKTHACSHYDQIGEGIVEFVGQHPAVQAVL